MSSHIGRVALLVGIVSSLPAMAVAGGDRVEPNYMGSFANDANAAITFDVQRANGVRKRVLLEASDVSIYCDDGSSQEIVLQPVRFPFRSARVFYDLRRSFNPDLENGGTYEVRGRITRGGTARGFLRYEEFEASVSPIFTCATDGKMRWVAERVR